MTPEERQQLAELVRSHRLAQHLTAREVARRAGVDVGTVTLLERCKIAQPRIDSVRAIAQVLGIPLADLYATVHWLPPNELPNFRPYLRAKYHDLPEEAVARLERLMADFTPPYRTGPQDHEDER